MPSVYAASSPWSQTNWAGGSGQTSWSDTTKFSSSSNVTTSTTNQVTLTATSGWCSNTYCTSSWGYRRKVTFNNTDANLGVTSEALSNFPVLVKLTSSNIDYSKTQSAGQDIRFTDSSGNDLAYEIEKWDGTGTSWVWVKVPSISINSSTDYMYMYYGNSSATDHQQSTSVWDSNFKLVQHLKETSSTTTFDATSNGNNGTKVSATEPNPTTLGQINGAQVFDRSNDRISLTNNSSISLSGLSNFTLEGWINTTTINSQHILFHGLGCSTWANYYLSIGGGESNEAAATNKLSFGFRASNADGGPRVDQAANVSTNTWLYVVGTYNGTTLSLYVNGSLNNTAAGSGAPWASTENLNIGQDPGCSGRKPFGGSMDELRISSTTRSAAYIAASYKSETDAFNTYAAAEQIYSSTPGTLTSSIFDSGQGSDWGTLTYAATTPANTSVSVKIRTGNQSDLSDATAFTSCSAISSGSTVGGTSCATNTQRYAQYQISLANTDSISTPTFTSFSLAFSASLPTAPSSLSGSAASTSSITWSWTDNASNESGFYVQDTSGNTKCTVSSASSGTGSTVTCTESNLSPNTSYTRKVVAYNGSGNSTASSNASATTRAVPSPSLDSPSDNTYTIGDRSSFRFKTPTDNTTAKLYSDVSSYRLYVKDSDGKEIFSISGIPSSRTTDYTDDPKYVAKYEGFSDSDITNNYITVYTRSTANWGSSENDGKLKEGKNTWAVASRDGSNNETATERTIYYDTTAPTITLDKLDSFNFDSKYTDWYYTQLKPTLSGKASEQGTVNIIFDKKGFNTGILGGYGNFITANVNTDSSGNFSWTPELEYGEYKVTIKAKDQAGNTSSEIKFNLDVDSYDNLVSQGIIKTTPAKSTSEESKPTSEVSTTPQPTVTTQPKEGGPIIPPEPNILQKTGAGIVKTTSVIASGAWQSINTIGKGIASSVNFLAMTTGKGIHAVGSGVAFTGEKAGNAIAFVGGKTRDGLVSAGQGIKIAASSAYGGLLAMTNTAGKGLTFVGTQIGNGIGTVVGNTSSAIAQGYNNLADNAPGVAKTVLIGFRNGATAVGKGIADTTGFIASTTVDITKGTASVVGNVSGAIATTTVNTTKSVAWVIGNTTSGIAKGTSQLATNTVHVTSKTVVYIAQSTANTTGNAVKATKEGIAKLAFNVGQRTERFSDSLGFAIVKLGYLFVNEPTTISDVKVAKLDTTTAKITWNTNHPATSKVNYGLTQDFGQDIQSQKRVTQHEIVITGLKPNTQYFYEVMSQNKNYVFDANHNFTTLDDGSKKETQDKSTKSTKNKTVQPKTNKK